MDTRVKLQGGSMCTPVEVDAPTGSRLIDVVRDLARETGLPLYWRCGQGTCGACLVYLEHADTNLGSPLVLGGKERNVLARMGHLGEMERQAASLADSTALPRLACHVVLPPGWLTVRW